MPVQALEEFSPNTPGGVCFVCKASRRSDDKVLDFTPDVEALGWVVPTAEYLGWEVAAGPLQLCSSCIGEAANLLGYIAPAKAESLTKANKDLRAKAREAEARIERLETAISSLRALTP